MFICYLNAAWVCDDLEKDRGRCSTWTDASFFWKGVEHEFDTIEAMAYIDCKLVYERNKLKRLEQGNIDGWYPYIADFPPPPFQLREMTPANTVASLIFFVELVVALSIMII
jgi:hypothetical protein